MDLQEVQLAEDCTYQIIMIIPKGCGDFRGIGLVEVLWKTVLGIINFRIASSIALNQIIHGLRAVWGMGTASLKFNLIH